MNARPVLRAAGAVVLAAGLFSCHPGHSRVQVHPAVAEQGAPAAVRFNARVVISDLAALEPMYRPVSDQVGLIVIRTRDDWRRLLKAAPELEHGLRERDPTGSAPDFGSGTLVGLVCRSGTPVDGQWPFAYVTVRTHGSAGAVLTDVNTGCYHADALALLETAYIEGVSDILVVGIGSARFYPD